jgi:hypothetical protein
MAQAYLAALDAVGGGVDHGLIRVGRMMVVFMTVGHGKS